MSRKEKSRIDTGGGNGLGVNPFGSLGGLGDLPQAPASVSKAENTESAALASANKKLGRIDIRREKSGRGGKVVTTLSGDDLAALSDGEREALLKQLKNRFGCGGSCAGSVLEVQGNLVDQLTPVLTQMGWRVVRTGG